MFRAVAYLICMSPKHEVKIILATDLCYVKMLKANLSGSCFVLECKKCSFFYFDIAVVSWQIIILPSPHPLPALSEPQPFFSFLYMGCILLRQFKKLKK